jgi:hypothetical protein
MSVNGVAKRDFFLALVTSVLVISSYLLVAWLLSLGGDIVFSVLAGCSWWALLLGSFGTAHRWGFPDSWFRGILEARI